MISLCGIYESLKEMYTVSGFRRMHRTRVILSGIDRLDREIYKHTVICGYSGVPGEVKVVRTLNLIWSQ